MGKIFLIAMSIVITLSGHGQKIQGPTWKGNIIAFNASSLKQFFDKTNTFGSTKNIKSEVVFNNIDPKNFRLVDIDIPNVVHVEDLQLFTAQYKIGPTKEETITYIFRDGKISYSVTINYSDNLSLLKPESIIVTIIEDLEKKKTSTYMLTDF